MRDELSLGGAPGGRDAGPCPHVRPPRSAPHPALEAEGDAEEVTALLDAAIARGTGADRQRQAFDRAGRLDDVVDRICRETAGTTD